MCTSGQHRGVAGGGRRRRRIQELEAIEVRDSVFPDIEPELWATTEAVLEQAQP